MAMTEPIAIKEPPMLSAEQVDLVKRTLARGATDDELRLFFYDCRRQGVSPLDRLIHFTKRSGRYTPITSIDFMRMRAADTGELAGVDDVVFGETENRFPMTATVTLYRLTQGQRYPYTATARWEEYYPGDGEQGFMWRKMPKLMLGKCSEALVLRKAFPKQLHGLYEKAELDQAREVIDEAGTPEAGPESASPGSETSNALRPGPHRGRPLKVGAPQGGAPPVDEPAPFEYKPPRETQVAPAPVLEGNKPFLINRIQAGLKTHSMTELERQSLKDNYLAGKMAAYAEEADLNRLYLFLGDKEAVAQWRKERAKDQGEA